LRQRLDLLLASLLVGLADAIDLFAQVSNLVFIPDLSLSPMAGQAGEEIIVKDEIDGGGQCPPTYCYD
jgi:hypothetical protein